MGMRKPRNFQHGRMRSSSPKGLLPDGRFSAHIQNVRACAFKLQRAPGGGFSVRKFPGSEKLSA
jgi:hypothetical protein